jgi:hypothetical protein
MSMTEPTRRQSSKGKDFVHDMTKANSTHITAVTTARE